MAEQKHFPGIPQGFTNKVVQQARRIDKLEKRCETLGERVGELNARLHELAEAQAPKRRRLRKGAGDA